MGKVLIRGRVYTSLLKYLMARICLFGEICLNLPCYKSILALIPGVPSLETLGQSLKMLKLFDQIQDILVDNRHQWNIGHKHSVDKTYALEEPSSYGDNVHHIQHVISELEIFLCSLCIFLKYPLYVALCWIRKLV